MSLAVLLNNALRLPVHDWAALIRGQMIIAMPTKSILPGLSFALFPDSRLTLSLPVEEVYHPNHLPASQDVIRQSESSNLLLRFWGRCEFCQVLDRSSPLEFWSKSTIWTQKALEARLAEQPYLFLAYLRVYKMSQLPEVIQEAQGEFVPLAEPLMVSDSLPVLSGDIFEKRKRQLENLEPPEHPELEELYSAIANFPGARSVVDEIQQDLRVILGWSDMPAKARPDPDLDWIKTIADVGNSSDGQTFEKLVRRGLIKLGFQNSINRSEASLDPEATGGAGGLDFYCDSPYFLVGECKATKTTTVPDGTAAQLIKLGYKHLQEHYDQCVKLIVAAGDLTSAALQTSIGNKINVIRPETLQSLVEMQATYRGSVDLIELKKCLQDTYGLVDEKIEQYLAQVRNNIKVRAQVIEAIKQLTEPDKKQLSVVEVRVQYNAMFAQDGSPKLIDATVHELLIELSSPLTGYLGRVQGSSLSSDRFYFLRDLAV